MDKLIQQVESILAKQRVLEKENQKLQDEVEKLKKLKGNDLKVLDYEKTIKVLNERLEKLLKECK